ncbi:hypothetical protein Tco_0726908 [Tanacetum coccineum]|uniref:Uncharacterized protein n=1 Tax=Tanacetum coccineum TaxID=301880 RepID=A0ABQ4YHV0_9ASTR
MLRGLDLRLKLPRVYHLFGTMFGIEPLILESSNIRFKIVSIYNQICKVLPHLSDPQFGDKYVFRQKLVNSVRENNDSVPVFTHRSSSLGRGFLFLLGIIALPLSQLELLEIGDTLRLASAAIFIKMGVLHISP